MALTTETDWLDKHQVIRNDGWLALLLSLVIDYVPDEMLLIRLTLLVAIVVLLCRWVFSR